MKRASLSNTWLTVGLLFFAACINYIDRGSLSVAAPALAKSMDLSPSQIGFLLSAFFWSYTAFQIPSGWLTDRLPVLWIFGAGYLLWSSATLASGLASTMTTLVCCRLVLGIGESVAFPAYSKIIATGFPSGRRGLPNALLDAGTKLGPAAGTFVGGLLVADYGWRAMFVVLGVASLVWLVPWSIWAPRTAIVRTADTDSPSMLEIACLPAAWGTFLGSFSYTYSYYFLLTWLPSYLVNERHVSLKMMGVLGSIPFLWSALSAVVCGWTSDAWIQRGASPTRVRKAFVVAGLLLSTIMVPAAMVSNLTLCVTLLSVAYIAFGMYASNHWAITQTLAGPAAAGKWSGLQNTVGQLSGVIAPLVSGYIVEATGHYFWAFLSPAIIAVFGAACYVFLIGPVEVVEWPTRGTA
jgi:MFS transporter, ACS family, D-galactonate transporter